MRARHRHFSHKAAGAVVAYDARYLTQSDGTALQTWTDRTGSYNATEATSTKRPTVKTGANGINGMTALQFDGTDDDLQAASVPLNTFITFVFCGSAFTSAKQFICEHGPNTGAIDGFYVYGDQLGAWSTRRGGAHFGGNIANWFGQNAAVGSFRYNGSAQYRKNGGSNLSNASGGGSPRTNSSTTNALNICSRNRASLFSEGLLGSLAVYNGSASDSMLKRIEHAAAYSFKLACS